MTTPKYLTKSQFKIAFDCLTKLYYTGKRGQYADNSVDNSFLESLANGGFQVGELAKYMFCEDPVAEGITIESSDYVESVELTRQRLSRTGKVVIAEAAFLAEQMFIRADLVVKEGTILHLYEVKAKSFDDEANDDSATTIDSFISFKGKPQEKVNTKWVPYLYDLAFQKYVIQKAYPQFEIRAHLILPNKQAKTTVDNLNQLFRVARENDNVRVIPAPGLKKSDLGDCILTIINLDDILQKIYNKYHLPTERTIAPTFEQFVRLCLLSYANDDRIFTPLSSKCKKCQFKISPANEKGLQSGFHECWKEQTNLYTAELEKPLVLDLWLGKSGNRNIVDGLISQHTFLLESVTAEQIQPIANETESKSQPGLTPTERRILQIELTKSETPKSYFDKEGFLMQSASWVYPLHMIDFETSTVALPFHKGAKSYLGIAFQFSHHIMQEDGTIEHADQFLHLEQGVYPNIEFIRALKQVLEKDNGTIFRYHNHENTYLRMIHRQLKDGLGDISDAERAETMAFIDTITTYKDERKKIHTGARNMVDMYELVLKYYYSPWASGSNSIKSILPAIIKDSTYLREKYSGQGVYGKNLKVKSLNFDDHIWISQATSNDPYKTLPAVFSDHSKEDLDNLVNNLECLADGGSALTAYGYLQYTDLSPEKRQNIKDALLRYCELDTMAMVMILEGWTSLLD